MGQAEWDIHRKKPVLEFAAADGNVSRTCCHARLSRETFYEWKRAFEKVGDEGLTDRKPFCAPGTSPLRTPFEIEEKVLHLRRIYHFGPARSAWDRKRFHGTKMASGGTYYIEDTGTQDLSLVHAEECYRLRGLGGLQVPISDPYNTNRPRLRVPIYIPWHTGDQGMSHIYIKSRTPNLNNLTGILKWPQSDFDGILAPWAMNRQG